MKHDLDQDKVILKGGIVKAAAWLDLSINKRNTDIDLKIYDSEKFSSTSRQGDYISTFAVIRNDMPDDSAIVSEGKYTLVVKNKIDYKVRATQGFTVKDGDTKQLNLIITE